MYKERHKVRLEDIMVFTKYDLPRVILYAWECSGPESFGRIVDHNNPVILSGQKPYQIVDGGANVLYARLLGKEDIIAIFI